MDPGGNELKNIPLPIVFSSHKLIISISEKLLSMISYHDLSVDILMNELRKCYILKDKQNEWIVCGTKQ